MIKFEVPQTHAISDRAQTLASLEGHFTQELRAPTTVRQQRDDIINETRFLAQCAVEETMERLASAFDLGDSWRRSVPTVEVLDEVGYRLRAFHHGSRFIDNSHFLSAGLNYYGQPDGPVISFSLAEFSDHTLIEECVHALRSANRLPYLMDNIRAVHESDILPGEYGLLEVEGTEFGSLVIARLKPPSARDSICEGIVEEFAAMFVRCKFGSRGEFIQLRPLGADDFQVLGLDLQGYKQLFPALIAKGSVGLLEVLERENKSSQTVEDYFEQDSNLGAARKKLFIALMGYELGISFAAVLQSPDSIKAMGTFVFSNEANGEKGLNELWRLGGKLYHKEQRAK